MRPLLRAYERLMVPIAIHGPDYNLLVRRNDGRAHGLARLAFHASWALYAAAIVALFAGVAPHVARAHPIIAAAAAVSILLSLKVSHVLAGIYRPDPVDWACDVGAWGTAGALAIAQLLLGAGVPWVTWPVLGALYLFSYPWAT